MPIGDYRDAPFASVWWAVLEQRRLFLVVLQQYSLSSATASVAIDRQPGGVRGFFKCYSRGDPRSLFREALSAVRAFESIAESLAISGNEDAVSVNPVFVRHLKIPTWPSSRLPIKARPGMYWSRGNGAKLLARCAR